MTASDTHEDPTPAAPTRRLRRVHDGRVGAGVAAGLGQYFGLDPVLFRVLFATSAFFGGAGVIAYLLAWAAIPDEGTEHAAIDGWFAALRRRGMPMWIVGVVGGLLIWGIAFSWWAPGRFFPVLAVIALVLFFVARRDREPAVPSTPPPAPPVDLRKHAPDEMATAPMSTVSPAPARVGGPPTWVADGRSWFDEARAAGRERRHRAQPVRIITLTALVVTLAAFGIADAATGIPMVAYFWTGLAILVAGLLVGLAMRRPAISLGVLAIPFAIGAIAFAGSSASLHDGVGQKEWTPTGNPSSEYRLAAGQGVLDLRSMDKQTHPRHIDVTMGAGRALIILPKTLNATVNANVHFGDVLTDYNHSDEVHGVGVSHTVQPPAAATGQPVTIDVHLADGNITVDRR